MERLYFYLFNEISSMMEQLAALQEHLISVQQTAEERYISLEDGSGEG